MKFIKKLFAFVIRAVLGLLFILYGIYNLSHINYTKNVGIEHMNILEKKGFFPTMLKTLISENLISIGRFMDVAFIYSGILMIFGFSMAKYFAFIAVAIEGALISSPRFRGSEFNYSSFLTYLSLAGVALNIA